MASLNIDSFNDILFKALKDSSVQGKIDMIEAELSMVANIIYDEMALLMDDLEKEGYESERFSKIKNIKANTERLLERLEELKAQLPEEDSNDKQI